MALKIVIDICGRQRMEQRNKMKQKWGQPTTNVVQEKKRQSGEQKRIEKQEKKKTKNCIKIRATLPLFIPFKRPSIYDTFKHKTKHKTSCSRYFWPNGKREKHKHGKICKLAMRWKWIFKRSLRSLSFDVILSHCLLR